MIIYLCYGYKPDTTAVYFERALRRDHEVYYIGPGYGAKPGYPTNVDLLALMQQGLPRPDLVLFIESGVPLFPRGLEKLACPTACYLIDVHQSLWVRELYAPFFDYLFVAQRDYVAHFQRLGYPNVFWLPLACDPELHGQRDLPRTFDVGFVGAVNSEDRRRRLESLTARFSMNDWTARYPKERIADVYSQSRIVFNTSVNGDLNMRIFEGLASGAMLITDAIDNGQTNLFADGVHLVQYHDDDELLRRVEHYLADDESRERIAAAGTTEVLARHTYAHRAATIIDLAASPGVQSYAATARRMSEARLRAAYAAVFAMMRRVDPVLDEFETAWQQGQGRARVAGDTVKALGRRANRVMRLSPGARAKPTRIQKVTPS